MNDYQIAKLKSYKLIVEKANSSPTETALVPKFVQTVTRLATITQQIDTLAGQQVVKLGGVTDNKRSVHDQLCDSLVDVSGALYSYAHTAGNKELLAKVNYSETAITKMTDKDLENISFAILAEAETVAPEALTEEGITAEELAGFKALCTTFKEISNDPRAAIIDRAGYTQQLADLFAEASALKQNMLDRLASQFRRKAPEFYQTYKAAATVIYKHSSKPAADAAATGSAS